MLTQDMFFHKSSPMLLVVRNHTFPPFGGITSTITLVNIMANHTMHSLKHNTNWLIAIIHHQKNVKGETNYGEGPLLFN